MPLSLPSQNELDKNIETLELQKIKELILHFEELYTQKEADQKILIDESVLTGLTNSHDYLSTLDGDKSKELTEVDQAIKTYKSTYEKKVESLNNYCQELTISLDILKQLDSLIDQKINNNLGISNLDNLISRLTNQVSATRTSIESSDLSISSAAKKLTIKRAAFDKVNADKKSLHAQQKSAKSDFNRLNNRVEVLNESIKTMSEKHEDVKDSAAKNRVDYQLTAMQKDLKVKNAEKEKVSKTIELIESQIIVVDSKIEPAKHDFNKAKQDLKLHKSNKKSFEEEYENLKRETSQQRKNYTTAQQVSIKIEGEISQLKLKVENSMAKLKNVDKIAATEATKYERLTKDFNELAYKYSPGVFEIAGNTLYCAVSTMTSYLPSMPSWSLATAKTIKADVEQTNTINNVNNDSISSTSTSSTSLPALTPAHSSPISELVPEIEVTREVTPSRSFF